MHQRFGAMMPGAHGDTLPIEQGRDIVGVGLAEDEGDHPAAVLRLADDT